MRRRTSEPPRIIVIKLLMIVLSITLALSLFGLATNLDIGLPDFSELFSSEGAGTTDTFGSIFGRITGFAISEGEKEEKHAGGEPTFSGSAKYFIYRR